MNYSFEDYEVAILNTLVELKKPAGYLTTLKGYGQELDDKAALNNFVRGFPGVLVEVMSAKYDEAAMTYPYYQQKVLINILIGTRSYRSQDAARLGTTGAFQILDDVRSLLLGSTLDLEIRPLRLIREGKIGSKPIQIGVPIQDPILTEMIIYLAEYELINDRIQAVT